ncbi:MAG: PBP1A family penicillin-binding protein [Candidatus Babeliales bacterium]
MLRRLIIAFSLFLCLALGCIVFLMERDWVDFSKLDSYKPSQASVVLDDDGNEIANFALDKRAPVAFTKIPPMVVKAFVAAEDHNFFTHPGISFRGIIRSALVNLYHGRKVQGASTITQQLARGMFLSYERTYLRKIQEIFLALQLERQLSKEQIFELYLNNMYFGRGIYGIEAACKRFWNIPLERITTDQAATLAAVAKSARLFSPLNAPANARRRRNIILESMYKLSFLTRTEYETAAKTSLRTLDYAAGNPLRLYIQEWIRAWAETTFGKEAIYHHRFKIKTTINLSLQEKAEHAFARTMQQLRATLGSEINGGLVSLDPETGHIKALIGGFDFRQSQFNRALQARRQIGSTFKPLLYALAMKAGIEMDSVFVDEPLTVQLPNGTTWQPRNWTNTFDGPMTLARALTFSNNIITAKLFLKIGAPYVVSWAQRFGITHLLPYPSASLGTAEATVAENAAAFNVFANNGVYVRPALIEWVKDETGNKMWQAETEQYRVLDTTLASKMVNLLSHRMNMLKHQNQEWIDADTIGKTGSTNGAATTWFVGATPSLTTALYVGRDDNKPMGSQLFASGTAIPIWMNFYKAFRHRKKHFYIDPQLREYSIDWVTGSPSDRHDDPDVITLLR